ncbi:NAD(P)/FAD-dependent oxidoreductase [Longimicrobium terrae]|uniref:Flavin-dependent dehydrogenase n=1 Tax=Longimicrobium terrae TaxID=1639882 RepID=A0A841GLG0_9BACT|nr:FAD-dependent monooxygenase [Longimicrobium terrae]MBB4635043.1 flavin-dependent dehydrogenase [Longimicrobium terrae]MBB6069437.1 flavin-dependent dehydrogenase [Longimicrobium terrae]NNC31759.1 oxidoreductase [Longimicrobium terrae]
MTDGRFHAVVAGGGPAGAAAALALARGGRRVLLAEDRPRAAFRIGEALAPAALPLLRDLGVLDRVLAAGHLPRHGNLSSWGSAALHANDFIFDPNGHGLSLDRARFDASLRDGAEAAGVRVQSGARVASAARDGSGWRVVLRSADGAVEEAACDWLVDATGRSAAIARQHGAARMHSDGLVAFYARFTPDRPGDRDARTMIESTPDGWWYTALVPGGERVVAWLTDADLAERTAMLAPEGFVDRLLDSTHVAAALHAFDYTMTTRPRGADAGSARLDRFTGEGWIAVGDAALSFDPLSSQGMLTALYTGMRAGQALHAHLDGDASALGAYAARLEEISRAYDENRCVFYGYEARWADHPFWTRRAPAAAFAY